VQVKDIKGEKRIWSDSENARYFTTEGPLSLPYGCICIFSQVAACLGSVSISFLLSFLFTYVLQVVTLSTLEGLQVSRPLRSMTRLAQGINQILVLVISNSHLTEKQKSRTGQQSKETWLILQVQHRWRTSLAVASAKMPASSPLSLGMSCAVGDAERRDYWFTFLPPLAATAARVCDGTCGAAARTSL
jgi:hypothetical protein